MSALSQTYSEYSQVSLQYEVRIPEIKRIADIMVTFPFGWQIAHEIQLSPISIENLK